jgi:hypothetical protein
MTFRGAPVGDYRHVCAFFSSEDDEYRTILPLIQEGLDAGERVINLMPEDRPDHENRLRAAGMNVAAMRESHQLEIIKSEDAYLVRNGRFDGEGMLRLIPLMLLSGHDFGYPLTRLIAHAEHMTSSAEGATKFMEYESRLNTILPRYPDLVICTYDLNRVSAALVMDVLRTHPMVIIEGLLQVNPFFSPAEQFLRESGKRRPTPHRPQPSSGLHSGNQKRN